MPLSRPRRLCISHVIPCSVLLLLSFAQAAFAAPEGEYRGWLWEHNNSIRLPFRSEFGDLNSEEHCFGQFNISIAGDLNWSMSTINDVCWARETNISGRTLSNPPPFLDAFTGPAEVGTEPLVSAGGNLYEVYSRDALGPVNSVGQRLATMLSLSTDNLLVVGGYRVDRTTATYREYDYGRLIVPFVKSTEEIRNARTTASLVNTTWHVAVYEQIVDDADVHTESALASVMSLTLGAGGACTFSNSAIFPDFVSNGDVYTATQTSPAPVDFVEDRYVTGGPVVRTNSACVYSIDASKNLSISMTVTDSDGATAENFRFSVSDDNRYLVPVHAPSIENSPRAFMLGYRAASGMATAAIDNTYLFYLLSTQFLADGQGAIDAGSAVRDAQEFEAMGRGKIVFDSAAPVVNIPPGTSGNWFQCDIDMFLNEFEYEVVGRTVGASIAINGPSVALGNIPFTGCEYQLGTDGDISIYLKIFDGFGVPDETFFLRGYVNDDAEVLGLSANLVDPGADPYDDTSEVISVLAMKYTGDPVGDEDGDLVLSNYEEFQFPLSIRCSCVVDDFNGDGNADILWRNSATGQNWMYLMNGAQIVGSLGINTVPAPWEIVGNGDYNGDGSADTLWRNSVTGQNWLYLMNGATIDSSVGVNTVADLNWKVVGNGDYNGDGNADILWRNSVTGQNWMYLMTGANIDSSVGVNTVPTDWDIASSGDYNGDGRSDILWRNGVTGQNWLYLMAGATIDSSIGVNTVPTVWTIAGNGDYNGDGNADILWRNSLTGQNWMYLMSGATIDSSVGVNTVPTVWEIAADGDYNGDGNADILWRNGVTGQNWMYLMNGATIDSSVGVNTVPTDWEIVNVD